MKHTYYRDEEQRKRFIKRYKELKPRCISGIDEGWQPIVGEAALALDEVAPGWQCDQIKEKFGGLRFYIDGPEGASEGIQYAVFAIENHAESRANGICESCGAYATREESEGWLRTLCDECWTQDIQKRKDYFKVREDESAS